jgi:uncharacterized protein (DUF2267 family)
VKTKVANIESSKMTMPAPVSHAVQTLQVWLKELKDKGELADEAAAYSVLRSVLHQLRDRLTLEEGVDLGAKLPLIVRGLYYDGWRPHRVPRKLTKEKFLDELSKDILPHTYPVEWAVSTVFALIAHHCDPGEVADVIDQLPTEIKELWPETARSIRSKPPKEDCRSNGLRFSKDTVRWPIVKSGFARPFAQQLEPTTAP